MEERLPFYGKLRRLHEVVCYDCGASELMDATTVKAACAEARNQHDWSLGRDGRWRCAECRPRRFGEKTGRR